VSGEIADGINIQRQEFATDQRLGIVSRKVFHSSCGKWRKEK